MKRLLMMASVAVAVAGPAQAQMVPELGGLLGGGLPTDGFGAFSGSGSAGLDALNGGFDEFGGALPTSTLADALSGLSSQLRGTVINPVDSAAPDPLLLGGLGDLGTILVALNTGDTAGLPDLGGLPGGDNGSDDSPIPGGLGDLAGLLDEFPPDPADAPLLGDLLGDQTPLMGLQDLLGDDLPTDPADVPLLGDLLGNQDPLMALEDVFGNEFPTDPADTPVLGDILGDSDPLTALEELLGGAEGPEELTGLLEALQDPGNGLSQLGDLTSLLDDLQEQGGDLTQLQDLMDMAGDVEQLQTLLEQLTALQPAAA